MMKAHPYILFLATFSWPQPLAVVATAANDKTQFKLPQL